MELINTRNGIVKANEQCKAIDVRRQQASNVEIISKLGQIDREIFLSSTKRAIYEFGDEELVEKTRTLLNLVTKDIGIKSIDSYDATRFFDILKTYYATLTLSEVRMAFELAVTGKLDDFLPKDRYGNPDGNHYQSFNAAYVSKILNAYMKRKADAEYNVQKNIKVSYDIPKNHKDYYKSVYNNKLYNEYLRYKYTGVVYWNDINDFVIYEKLNQIGYSEPVIVTEEHKERAVKVLLKKGQEGVLNQFVTDCIRKLQTKHNQVPGEAFLIARRDSIIRSFNNMIKDEYQF